MSTTHTPSLSTAVSGWETPDTWPELPPNEIHLWLIPLELPGQEWRAWRARLDEYERTRAERFVDQRDQERYVIAHTALRSILARYLGMQSHAVHFTWADGMKPTLATDMGSDLRFNLSHSHKLAVCAVGRNREVGVDLEYVYHDFPYEMVVASLFSPIEQLILASLPPSQRVAGFYHGWTRKEAFVKALGAGLSLPLDSFDVSLAPGSTPELLGIRADIYPRSDWSLRDLDLNGAYTGALAAAGQGWRSRGMSWSWQS